MALTISVISWEKRSYTVQWGVTRCTSQLWHTVGARPHLPVYVAVFVNVVEVKRPLKLFSQCPSQQYRQTRYKVLAASGQRITFESECVVVWETQSGHKYKYMAISIYLSHFTTLITQNVDAGRQYTICCLVVRWYARGCDSVLNFTAAKFEGQSIHYFIM